MRAVAWVSVIKDFLMILAALSIGIYVPVHCFGGVGPLFHALATTHPAHLVMPRYYQDDGPPMVYLDGYP